MAAALRDALRFEFARLRAESPAVRREWTGALSFHEDVVAEVAAFVRRGPDDWRCHGITHFHDRVLAPAFDAAVAALLESSKVRVDEAGWTRLHETARRTVVYTSSLLLTATPRALNPHTAFERVVVDVKWDLVHLPDLARDDSRYAPPPPSPALEAAVWVVDVLRGLLKGWLW